MKAVDRRTDGAVAILPAFCQNYPHRPVRARINSDDQSRIQPAEQGERGSGGSSRTDPDEANPAENRKVGGSIPSLPTTNGVPRALRSTRGQRSTLDRGAQS